ncbi:MAG: hypothetical protein ACP5H8_03740, partial [Candidatus Micrarchaeia archaeon]
MCDEYGSEENHQIHMYCIEQCDTFFYHAIGTSTGKSYPLCLLSIKAKKCGGYFFSDSGFFIENPKHVSIGKNCSFNRGVFISATNEITIGDNVLIGPYCVLRDANHIYANRSIPIREQGHTDGKIV